MIRCAITPRKLLLCRRRVIGYNNAWRDIKPRARAPRSRLSLSRVLYTRASHDRTGEFSWPARFVNSRLLYHRYPVILCYYPVCLFGDKKIRWKALKLGCPRWLTESAITLRILARTYLPGKQHRPTAPTLHARPRKPVASLCKLHVSHPHGDFCYSLQIFFFFQIYLSIVF